MISEITINGVTLTPNERTGGFLLYPLTKEEGALIFSGLSEIYEAYESLPIKERPAGAFSDDIEMDNEMHRLFDYCSDPTRWEVHDYNDPNTAWRDGQRALKPWKY